MKKLLLILLLGSLCCPAVTAEDSIPRKKGIVRVLYEFVKEFSRVDTNYVEPQHYNFTAMLQNTNTYEVYRLSNRSTGRDVVFSPNPSVKLGPYFGWRWIFLGYTVDFSHLGGESKQDLNLSLYSNQIGVDLFYRKTGDDYKIRSITLDDGTDASVIKDVPFDGISASIKGFNLYYIFNHRKFSYPAAYSQSTVQRRSAGSFLAGIGYTHHSLNMDWAKLEKIVQERLGKGEGENTTTADEPYGKVKYTDFSLSGGYAYNWVFAYNWLFDASLSVALAYKHNSGDGENRSFSFRDFSLDHFNLDGVGRFGIVWNNTKWYVGANTIFHSYNYHKSQFSTNNFFGSVNIYIGFNFDKR